MPDWLSVYAGTFLLFDRLTGKRKLRGRRCKTFFCDGTVYAFRLGGIIFPDSQLCARVQVSVISGEKIPIWTGGAAHIFYAAVWRYGYNGIQGSSPRYRDEELFE